MMCFNLRAQKNTRGAHIHVNTKTQGIRVSGVVCECDTNTFRAFVGGTLLFKLRLEADCGWRTHTGYCLILFVMWQIITAFICYNIPWSHAPIHSITKSLVNMTVIHFQNGPWENCFLLSQMIIFSSTNQSKIML